MNSEGKKNRKEMNDPNARVAVSKSLLHVMKSPRIRKNGAGKKLDGQNFPKFGDDKTLQIPRKPLPGKIANC